MILIPCGAAKSPHPARARDLYTGAHFRRTLRLATSTGQPVRILSALYGLADLDAVLRPYDVTVAGLAQEPRARLVDLVAAQLDALDVERLDLWLPRAYAGVAVQAASRRGIPTRDLLAGCRGIGEQRQRMAALANL